jgi:hypothetical protein
MLGNVNLRKELFAFELLFDPGLVVFFLLLDGGKESQVITLSLRAASRK